MRFLPAAAVLLCLAAAPGFAGEPDTGLDPDTDGDGLSDFQERHKYFTDPKKADSDGDGTPDGGWDERREYSYSLRTIVQVAPPVDEAAMNDDYQDARVLDRAPDYVEVEVIHYPLNTVAKAVRGDKQWRATAARMTRWTQPGVTANWDAKMKQELITALKKDGIDVQKLDDKQLVTRVSTWLLRHAEGHDGFTTFYTHFPDGKPAIYPGLDEAFERGRIEKGMSNEDQWARDMFAKGMFETKRRGSCTSSAIYYNGCLRALGIPTRIVLTIPVIDPSDARELEMVAKRLEHHRVRETIHRALAPLKGGWSGHTYNEVFVGGRWRRLNYNVLGQNILDKKFFGLMTSVNTVSDWADLDIARTWGVRQGTNRRPDDPFGGTNPFSAISVSDRFGKHAKIDNPEVARSTTAPMKEARIDWVAWSDSKRFPKQARAWLRKQHARPVLLLHVENFDAWDPYKVFTFNADREFRLEADGKPALPVTAHPGGITFSMDGKKRCWATIELDDATWERMEPGVPYRVRPLNAKKPYAWKLDDALTVRRE